jgi:hypothetical protein
MSGFAVLDEILRASFHDLSVRANKLVTGHATALNKNRAPRMEGHPASCIRATKGQSRSLRPIPRPPALGAHT